MNHNPHFIKLLEILEERDWQYDIMQDVFYIVLGNQEFEFSKHNKLKTLALIEAIENW